MPSSASDADVEVKEVVTVPRDATLRDAPSSSMKTVVESEVDAEPEVVVDPKYGHLPAYDASEHVGDSASTVSNATTPSADIDISEMSDGSRSSEDLRQAHAAVTETHNILVNQMRVEREQTAAAVLNDHHYPPFPPLPPWTPSVVAPPPVNAPAVAPVAEVVAPAPPPAAPVAATAPRVSTAAGKQKAAPQAVAEKADSSDEDEDSP